MRNHVNPGGYTNPATKSTFTCVCVCVGGVVCLFVFLLSHMLLPCQFLEIIVRHSDKEKGNFSNIRIIIYDVSFSYTSELDLCNGHNVAYMPADPIASIYTCHIVLQFHCQNTRWQWSI